MSEYGWTQSELAIRSGISQKSISNILSGRQSPTLDTVELLSGALGLPAWSLLVSVSEKENTLGERLRVSRKKAGYTQKEAADSIGITQASISDLENGETQRTKYIIRFSQLYKVNPVWLSEGAGSPDTLTTKKGNLDKVLNVFNQVVLLDQHVLDIIIQVVNRLTR